MTPSLYIDMDGVLCNMVQSACELIRHVTGSCRHWTEVDRYDFWEDEGLTNDEFWSYVKSTVDFWEATTKDRDGKDAESIKRYEWSDRLLDGLVESANRNGADLYVATQPTDQHCAISKRRWIAHHYPGVFKDVICLKDKSLLARYSSVLLDDNPVITDKWGDAGGGAVLFPQPWNAHGKMPTRKMLKEAVSAVDFELMMAGE